MVRFPYLLYRHTTAIKFWLFRRILPSGRGALISAVISATMLMGSPIKPLYQLFALLFGLCSVALAWAWFRRAHLHVQRNLPTASVVGVPLHYDVLVTNHGRSLPHWSLQETAPDPRPAFAQFAHSREPGEARRNHFDRALGFHRWQWLLHQNQKFVGGQSPPQDPLAKEMTVRVPITLTPQKRGALPLHDLRVLLPDPFRFFQRARSVQTAHDSIIVLPRRYPWPACPLSRLGHRHHDGELTASLKKGSHGEFAALREYRRGDPPRLIHQKSWARLGRPVVVEWEELSLPRFALVLDTFAQGAEAEFEVAVSVAASLISDADSAEAWIERLILGDQGMVSAPAHGRHSSQKLLESLALVGISTKEDFPGLRETISRQSANLSGVVMIFCQWSESRARFLEQIQSTGLAVIALCVEHGQTPRTDEIHRIRPQHVAQDLQRLASFAAHSA
jgi:hypothetical protein